MAQHCKAKTKSGAPCQAWAGQDGYCFFHSPARRKAQSAARKLGGYNRQTQPGGDWEQAPTKIRTLEDVLTVLDFALADALQLENSIARGRLLVAMANAYSGAIKVSEFEKRIEALEEKVYGKSFE